MVTGDKNCNAKGVGSPFDTQMDNFCESNFANDKAGLWCVFRLAMKVTMVS